MDEQRVQAYMALIEQLLTCPQGQEGEVQAQAELVDAGLLMVMAQYANRLEQQGNSNAARLKQICHAGRLGTAVLRLIDYKLQFELRIRLQKFVLLIVSNRSTQSKQ